MKIRYTTVYISQFSYIKVGFNGICTSRKCFPDVNGINSLLFKKHQVLQSYLDGKEDEENLVYGMVKESHEGFYAIFIIVWDSVPIIKQ